MAETAIQIGLPQGSEKINIFMVIRTSSFRIPFSIDRLEIMFLTLHYVKSAVILLSV